MHFWEGCFQQRYHAFTHGYHTGRANVLWWLNQANARDLLPWGDLGRGTLQAVIRIAGPLGALGTRATQELQRYPDAGLHLGPDVLRFERPNYADAITGFVLDRTEPDRASFGHRALWSLYTRGFTEFISRFYLIDTRPAFRLIERVLEETYWEWDYLGTLAFESDLLRRTLGQMPRWQPQTMPLVTPAWLNTASAEEQTFLRRTLVLERIERLVLFLTVYAALAPWEIAPAVTSRDRRWAPREIELLLKRAWEKAYAVL
jgi:hypothetical protein